jgi:hypothetical protein
VWQNPWRPDASSDAWRAGGIRTAVQGTLNLPEVAREAGARILIASTSEVYGDPAEHPQRESYWGHVNPIGPRACYDEGKRCAETLATAPEPLTRRASRVGLPAARGEAIRPLARREDTPEQDTGKVAELSSPNCTPSL